MIGDDLASITNSLSQPGVEASAVEVSTVVALTVEVSASPSSISPPPLPWDQINPTLPKTLSNPRQHPMNVAPPAGRSGDRKELPPRRHMRPDNPPSSLQHTILKNHLSHLPFPSPNSSNHQLASAKVLPYASAANHCEKNWRVGAVLPKFACIHFPNQLEELRFFKQHPAIHSYEVVTPTTLSTTPHP